MQKIKNYIILLSLRALGLSSPALIRSDMPRTEIDSLIRIIPLPHHKLTPPHHLPILINHRQVDAR